MTDQICVIDFGESFHFSLPPANLGMPDNYLPPDVLLEDAESIGLACDLWAPRYTLFEIRQKIALFYLIFDPEELPAEMIRFFSKFPERWWDK